MIDEQEVCHERCENVRCQFDWNSFHHAAHICSTPFSNLHSANQLFDFNNVLTFQQLVIYTTIQQCFFIKQTYFGLNKPYMHVNK